MIRLLWILVLAQFALMGVFGVVIWLQQDAITSLVTSQITETYRAAKMSADLANVQRRLMFMERERSKRLNKVARQADLNTVALRLGSKGRRKFFSDRKVRHFLGF